MKYALLVQPAFDKPTSIQAKFFMSILNNIINLGKLHNIATVTLFGDKANIDEFRLAIAKYDPVFVYFGGHGVETAIYGNSDPLILLGYNQWLLRDRIVYAFNCRSVSVLGRMSQAKAVIGYDKEYLIYNDERYLPVFFNLGFRPLLLLYQGYTVKKVYESTLNLYKYYLTRVALPDDIKEVIEYNYESFNAYGDPNARL